MKQTYNAKAASFQNRSHRRRSWRRVFFGMAMVVVFVTTYMLILPAITMENNLVCGLEAHTHTDDCYATQLVCVLEEAQSGEAPAHVHGDGCYEQRESLACGLTEDPHSHGEGCYAVSRVSLCGDPAHEGHSHGEDCFEEQETLLCAQEETQGHRHDEELCYGQVQDLICELPETEGHSHSGDCYGLEQVQICGLAECQDSHTDDCWAEETELTCALAEGDVHTHDENCMAQEEVLVCTDSGAPAREVSTGETPAAQEPGQQAAPGAEAVEEHFHGAACYQRELICTLPEHIHDENCERDAAAQEEQLIVLPEGAQVPADCDKEYTFTDEQGRLQAAVYAPGDALPQGAQLRVSLLPQDSPDYISAAKALTDDYAGLLALDIRFELDGAEVEPTKPIYVCINAPDLLPQDADPASITVAHHLEADSAAVEVVAGPEGGLTTNEEGGLTAAFGVDHLSVFTVRWARLGTDDLPQLQTGADTLAQGLVFHLFDYDPEAMEGSGLPLFGGESQPGILGDTLGEDGYPVLVGGDGQSLARLFDPQTQAPGKITYPNANLLLREEEGGYSFHSGETFAQLAGVPEDYTLAGGETVQSYPFTLYDQTGGGAFLPFNQPGQEEENLAFGMSLTTAVSMPEMGMAEGAPAALELGGSDDMWLFLDGKLVLDLGGSEAGLVNFSAEASVTAQEGGVTVGPGQVWTEAEGLRDLWALLGLEEPWEAGSTHNLSLFYLNRGESQPTFHMNLNLPAAVQEPMIFLEDIIAQLPLSLKLQGAEQVVGTTEAWLFHFFMTQVDGPEGSLEPGGSGNGTMTTLAVSMVGSQTGMFNLAFQGDTPEGTYYYKVYQDDSAPREGVAYDTTYYIAVVEVADGAAAVTGLQRYVDGEVQEAEEVTFTNVAAAEGTLTLNNVVNRVDGTPQKASAVSEFTLVFSTSVLDKDYRTYYAPYTNQNLTEGGLVHATGDGRLAFTVDRIKGTATAHLELYPGETITITLPAGAEVRLENLWTVAFDIKWTGDTATGNEVAGAVATAAPIGGDVELTCISTTGYQLPETGGMGAEPLLVIGTLLTIGAGGILLALRRKGGIFSA